MLQRVYDLALQAGADEVVIATDHEAILECANQFGAKALMTREDHENGTERLAEVVEHEGWSNDSIVVNLQGDEPLIPVELIQMVATNLADHPKAGIASLATPLSVIEDVFNPNIVKVVCDQSGYALYFSRAPIPWSRDTYPCDSMKLETSSLPNTAPVLRHIGMYAYRVSFLRDYQNMQPTGLEQAESLEQLRALFYGTRIHMGIIQHAPPHGVDTPEDLERVKALLAKKTD